MKLESIMSGIKSLNRNIVFASRIIRCVDCPCCVVLHNEKEGNCEL